jgi:FAD:protein FMN transferase
MKSVSSKLLRARPLLGTFVEITAANSSAAEAEQGIDAAFATVQRVHDLMSFHDARSDVSRLNQARFGETIVVHGWTYRVLEVSLELHHRSKGSFNIAVAPALQRLGFLPGSAQDASSPDLVSTGTTVDLLSGNRVRVRERGSKIDLGGSAKGFAVDRAVDVLREHGIQSGLVNAGGDLAAFGAEEHIVAIRDPRDPSRLMCHVVIEDAALASSALMFDPVEPSGVVRSAVVDPESCQPVRVICGATARASSCLIADALTKLVMVTGTRSSEVLDHYAASALFVMANGEVEMTTDWQYEFSVAA